MPEQPRWTNRSMNRTRARETAVDPAEEQRRWTAAWTRRLREEEDRLAFPPCYHVLLPPACFPNEKPTVEQFRQLRPRTVPAGTGRHSQSVRMRLGLSCAGWRHWPTSEEFYEAVRAPRPTPRQRLILETWVTEAHWVELIHAWTEEAYTLRELATALHRAGLARCKAARVLNGWATQPNGAAE